MVTPALSSRPLVDGQLPIADCRLPIAAPFTIGYLRQRGEVARIRAQL
jgi:hypothetical protein